ncbi:MAG: ATP-dependent helicase [archaeon]
MAEYIEKPSKAQEIRKILDPDLRKWFDSKFKDFCLPQKYGIIPIHSRQNVLVSAPTGSGKTLTAFLSILNELIDSAKKGILENRVYAIYVSPLKALSNDIYVNLIEPLSEIEEIAGRKFGIRVAVRTGDTSTQERAKMLKKPPHILITTPESLAILLCSIKFMELMRNVQWCIVDEIHALADNKRGVHLALSLERLQRLSTYICRVGLSATVAPLEEIARFLVGSEGEIERDCRIVDVQFIKDMDLKVLSPVDDLVNATHQMIHSSLYNLIDDLIQEHKTTLVFTNTRAATERVVNHLKDRYPGRYLDNIGAHHGSLSKYKRREVETKLREGKLKAVVCSTSLELGIDIGYIDLVILLGSPKSVARGLQRIGRSGHRLHDTTKGRIIVLDRDDLVENSVLLKAAIEKKIDRIHIPGNCLDVLVQHVYGIAINEKIPVEGLYTLIRQCYCYRNLSRADFNDIIDYLSGRFISLEDRHVYAKIWHDEETGMIGRKGRLARVMYMTNIGTIPDESFITVKVGDQAIGKIDEGFLEKLHRGDVFVLGGEKYEFLYSRGMVAQVNASVYRPPTIPSWFSEMLPLSFDLALEIGRFRRLMDEQFQLKRTKEEIIGFVNDYLYVDKNGGEAIHRYFREQFLYARIPTDKRIVIEQYNDGKQTYIIFHALYGRRVNDCLSRAVAFVISRLQHIDVEIGISDNGFYVASPKSLQGVKAFKLLKADKLDLVMKAAIEKTEVFRRRFRHCATRALMILRNYKGREGRVGRRQVSSQILINAVKRIDPDFSILKEAKREVLEDLMDIDSAKLILTEIEAGRIEVEEIITKIPSPFSFSLIMQGYTDILKIEDKIEFLKRMHQMVLAKIGMTEKV